MSELALDLRAVSDESEIAELTRVENAEYRADAIPEHVSVEDNLAWFRNASPHFDGRRDVTLAWLGDRLVGYGTRSWVDTNDGEYREYRADGAVDPEYRRRGVGRALLRHNLQRVAEMAADHDTPLTKVVGTWCGDTQVGAQALLASEGFTPVRWFFQMRRPTLDDIAPMALPEGLEIRPMTDDLVRQVWLADMEAFRDHWGGFDGTDEALQRYRERPDFDISLWVIAWDGDQVAGGIVNGISEAENEALGVRRGWLHSVFTRRPWRKRGLAAALISRSLEVLRERGMQSAVLGVDADNPTGALGLYERAGFEVEYRSAAWRRPLETA